MDYLKLSNEVLEGKVLSCNESLELIKTDDAHTFELLAAAGKIRQKFFGNKVKLCAIINAKSGECSEDCSFCGQSAHHKTNIRTYPLLSADEILTAAKTAEKDMRATCFSIVTSGKSVFSEKENETVGKALDKISEQTKLNRCVSLGTLSLSQIKALKARGLKRLHHNLETAESFFNKICTTHSYAERLKTIKYAKEAGVEVCSGGIFGLGESLEQRVELAFTLRDLDVSSVPINILNPIAGTPAARNYKPMAALEVLRLVATYRFILPSVDLGVFGGREMSLRDLQPLMFIAGANVTLIGDYLTTRGQPPEKDLQIIADLGLEIDR